MKVNQQTNENMKHTPGPWHVNTLEVVPFSIHAHRGCVAEVSRGTMNEVGADEIEANARLIAAAPELLAALENLAARQISTTDHQKNTMAYLAARDYATAILSKVKGQL